VFHDPSCVEVSRVISPEKSSKMSPTKHRANKKIKPKAIASVDRLVSPAGSEAQDVKEGRAAIRAQIVAYCNTTVQYRGEHGGSMAHRRAAVDFRGSSMWLPEQTLVSPSCFRSKSR
jgi:hypothetical protein